MKARSAPSAAPAAFAALLGAVLLGACGDRASSRASDSSAGGTVVIASTVDADFLFPPLVAGVQGKQITDMLYDPLAEVGADLNTVGDRGFHPRLARAWRWAADSLSIAFELDPDARWHDGQPVRAADVRFTYRIFTDSAVGSPAATNLRNVDSVSVRDSLTAVVWFKRREPEQFFSFVYNTVILPEHVLGAIAPSALRTSPLLRTPVGSGRFRFARWDAGSRVELVADTTNYRGRPRLDRIVWQVTADQTAQTASFITGQSDFVELLRGAGVDQAAHTSSVRIVRYPSLDYGYLAFNFREPGSRSAPHHLFADHGLRLALSMSIDREALVQRVLDSLGLVGIGPLTRAIASADTTLQPPKFDVAASARMLDSLGWKQGADSVRRRGSTALAFSLLVPTSSNTRMQAAVILQEQLRRVGARVTIEPVEANTFFARLQAHKFDAMLNAWRTDPSPATVLQSWGVAAARDEGGANFNGYSNPAFDALVDSAARSYDPAASRQLYRRAYETILADAPAVWLYELRNVAGAHRRIQTPAFRADAWWAGMADWSIKPEERIDRDRIGLRTSTNSVAR